MRRPFENALGNAKLAVLSLLLMLGVSLILNVVLAVGLAVMPRYLQVYDVATDGNTSRMITPNHHTKAIIESFVSAQWVALTSWPANGAVDAPAILKRKRAYLSPTFIKQFQQMLQQLDQNGYLQHYIAVTTPIAVDTATHVWQGPDGDWLVKVKFLTRFYYNPYQAEESFAQLSGSKGRTERIYAQTITFRVVAFPNNLGLGMGGIVKVETDPQNPEALQTNQPTGQQHV